MKKNIVLSLLFLVTCNVALFAADEKSLDNSPSSKKRLASPWESPQEKRSKIDSPSALRERSASAPPGRCFSNVMPLFMSRIGDFRGSQTLTGRDYNPSPFNGVSATPSPNRVSSTPSPNRVSSTPLPSRASSAIGLVSFEEKVPMTIDDVVRNNEKIRERREWKKYYKKRLEAERINNLLTPEEKQESINNHIDGDAEMDYAQLEPVAYKLQTMEERRREAEEKQLALQAELQAQQRQGFILLNRSAEHRIYEYLDPINDSKM